MRWDRGHHSDDVIDQRSEGGGAPLGAGVGILFWLLSRFGMPGLLIGGVLLAATYFFSGSGSSSGDRRALGPGESRSAGARDEAAQFVGFVLDDVQATWRRIFAERNAGYTPAKLVLFREATRSGCGYGTAEVGPFYCPRDSRVYIDLAFYEDLARRFGAPGDFAQAYVIAHEIGHHVQNLIGDQERARALARGTDRENAASIRQELQADCYAGIWAHSTQKRDILEPGDLEEGLRAAAAVGDDTLQKQSGGRVSPESWTHGSSEQRMAWFKRGLRSGNIEDCDTSSAPVP